MTNRVQSTNDSSSISKASMVKQGYFDDKFSTLFIDNLTRRSPIINRGYYIRAHAINNLLTTFLQYFNNKDQIPQIVSLGSGYDTTYFRLKDLNIFEDRSSYFEIDFPDLQMRKRKKIMQSDTLLKLLHFENDLIIDGNIILNSVDYKLIGFDLRNLDHLLDVLLSAGLDPKKPTLILSEVVLAYLNPKLSNNIIKWSNDTFSQCLFATYEQIIPNDGFGKLMCNHFASLGSPLLSINEYPTADSQILRYKKLGWANTNCWNMNEYYLYSVPDEEKNRVDKLELFDEWEEWTLMCSHYIILIAANHSNTSKVSQYFFKLNIDPINNYENNRIECIDEIKNSQDQCSSTGFNEVKNVINSEGKIDKNTNHFLSNLLENNRQIDCSFLTDNLDSWDVEPLNCEDNVTYFSMLDRKNLVQFNNKIKHSISRFGHTSTLFDLNDTKFSMAKVGNNFSRGILTVGGFGVNNMNNQHIRVSHSNILIKEKNICENNSNLEDCDQIAVADWLLKQPSLMGLSFTDVVTGDKEELYIRLEEEFPMRLLHHTCTYVGNGKFFMFGGRTSPSKCFGAFILDINLDKFNLERIEQKSKTLKINKNYPDHRWRHASCIVRHSGNEGVLIFGGCNLQENYLNDFWIFFHSSCTWEKLIIGGVEGIGPGRHSHSMNRLGENKVVICGGLGVNSIPLSDIQILDLENLSIQQAKITSGVFAPRYSHCTDIIGNSLILFGGVGQNSDLPVLTIVDLITFTLVDIEIKISEQLTNPFHFFKHTMVRISDQKDLQKETTFINAKIKNSSILKINDDKNCKIRETNEVQKDVLISDDQIMLQNENSKVITLGDNQITEYSVIEEKNISEIDLTAKKKKVPTATLR